jgi:hypothetical protein
MREFLVVKAIGSNAEDVASGPTPHRKDPATTNS